MRYDSVIKINGREISESAPAYFIADIASNHDGDLARAKDLIHIAKRAGADAAKFQHFKATHIVSDYGFKNLGKQIAHQAAWKQSVYEIYRKCELNREWTAELAQTARKAGIDFMTSPYDFEAVDLVEPYVPAYKIGSGDITWIEILEYIARKKKPVILATGASTLDDVNRAVEAILRHNRQLSIMQCNTNYTGSLENFHYINLNVLKQFKQLYPGMVLGLSDHTPGHSTVLGAVAMGARVIEKHFTDSNDREGPDHPFSMNPATWQEMVTRTRELERSLGSGVKQIEANESESSIVQRRCVRLTMDKKAGEKIQKSDLECLRPAPVDSVAPHQLPLAVGKTLRIDKVKGDALYPQDLKESLC